MPKLVEEFAYHADLTVQEVGPGPMGTRLIGTIHRGQAEGARINGVFAGAGGDWLVVGSDGFGRIDVRGTIETPDGAHIYLQYFGLLEITPNVMAIIGGGGEPGAYGDQYFFTNPRLETGHEGYAWVNRTFFVGEGRLLPGPPLPGSSTPTIRVEYHVYRLEHG
jgi:hypothetical protein